MAYKALYRKWRPLTFDDVVGQEHITKTLKNEIINSKTAHAYLFTGTRGTGKTSSAKIFARAVNCENSKDGNPCNECDVCKGILDESILDVVEMDAASNTGVDNIRQIIEQVQYVATVAKYKVYIIDEVHMLSSGAFNALLKTLEEPPKGVIFILATTEVHKVPATILSRCQRFDFKTISDEKIIERIRYILNEEKISADEDAIGYVAYLGDGSMRDSLSILDQCLAFKADNLTYDDVVDIVGAVDDKVIYNICSKIASENVSDVIELFNKLISDGKNTDNFASSLMLAMRNLMIAKCTSSQSALGVMKNKAEEIKSVSEKFTLEKLSHCIEVINELQTNLKYSQNVKVLIEVALVRMTDARFSDSKAALLDRISSIEKRLSQGMIVRETVKDSSESVSEQPAHNDDYIPEPSDVTENMHEEYQNVDTGISPSLEEVIMNKDEINGWMFENGQIDICSALIGASFGVSGDKISISVESSENAAKLNTDKNKNIIKQAIKEKFDVDTEVEIASSVSVGAENVDEIFSELKDLSKNFPGNFNIN